MPSEQLGIILADAPYAERKDEPRKPDRPPRRNGCRKLGGGHLPPAFALRDLSLMPRERENIWSTAQ